MAAALQAVSSGCLQLLTSRQERGQPGHPADKASIIELHSWTGLEASGGPSSS